MKGFVLAGGRSTRMGRDKALLRFGPRPLIEHAVALLQRAGVEPYIAGSRPDLAQFAPVIDDIHPGLGPLGGIEAALACVSDAALFLPVDLPLLPAEFLIALIARAALTSAPATIPDVGGQPQPLCAVYGRNLLPSITAALVRGDGKVMRAVAPPDADIFSVEAVAAAQDNFGVPIAAHQWFANLNTPDDFARAGLS